MLLDKLMLHGTRAQTICDLGLKRCKILVNADWKIFLRKYREYRRQEGLKNDSSEPCILKDTPDNLELERQKETSLNFKYRPLISIIIPVYNPPALLLQQTLESVLLQTYDNWELCLADGNSRSDVRRVLDIFSQKDPRIKLKLLDENMGISGNSNSALSIASGEFITFLDHDDELSPGALYEVVKLLNTSQKIDFIYTDEDKKTIDGKRCDPFFKPDFSLELLRQINYLSHLVVIRRALVESVGGFSTSFDGAQDFDLFLKVIEKHPNIKHIRKILYHWKLTETSGAQNALAKPWIYEKGKAAVEQHLKRMGLDARVWIRTYWGIYGVEYDLKSSPPVDIIIPTRKLELFKHCLRSIEQSTYKNYDIYAVINGDTDYQVIKINTFDGNELEPFTDRDSGLIGPKLQYNWSRMNNLAIHNTKSPFIITLNDDIEIISKDWIENMLRYAQFNHNGAVGGMLLYKDGRIQHAGDFVNEEGAGAHCFNGLKADSFEVHGLAQMARECNTVTSACMMVRREIFERVGLFDENLRNFDDFEFCLRLRDKGYSIIYSPFVKAYHLESPTRPHILDQDSINYLLKKIGPREESFFRYEWLPLYKNKQ